MKCQHHTKHILSRLSCTVSGTAEEKVWPRSKITNQNTNLSDIEKRNRVRKKDAKNHARDARTTRRHTTQDNPSQARKEDAGRAAKNGTKTVKDNELVISKSNAQETEKQH